MRQLEIWFHKNNPITNTEKNNFYVISFKTDESSFKSAKYKIHLSIRAEIARNLHLHAPLLRAKLFI
jgi:hypothetical protein